MAPKLKHLGKLGSALLQNLRSKSGQFASGLTAMATLAWLLWPSDQWKFEPEAGVGLIVALIAWVGSHTGSATTETVIGSQPSAHDVALLERFRSVLTEEFRAFLRDHDFGASFRSENISPLFDVADTWRGEPFEFDDPALQEEFADLLQAIRQLSTGLALGTAPMRNPAYSSAIPDRERELDDPSAETLVRLRELNNRATEVTNKLDEFLRNARRKLLR